jgi:phenylalanyl-tRNA synthetase alpha chain
VSSPSRTEQLRTPVKKYLTPTELQSALALRDLTDPAGGPHALQLLLDEMTSGLQRLWHVEASTHRLSPLVATADNYDRLGYSADDVTRDSRYSRHVSPTVMLAQPYLRGHACLAGLAPRRTGPL